VNLSKCFVVDTNCLIYDPNAIEVLMNDVNEVYIHTVVIQELDNLKTSRDIGRDAREAIRNIDKLHIEKHPRFHIVQYSNWSDMRLNHLDKNKNDHNIIALAYNLMGENDKVVLISKDITVRILARDLGIVVEDYIAESIKIDDTKLKEVEVPYSNIDKLGNDYIFRLPDMSGFVENEGAIVWSDWNGCLSPESNTNWKQNFAAIKKGDKFHIIPNDISMMGLTPYMMNGSGKNWEQYVAMAQLMDDSIRCVFLIGGAGSGKTMLGLASALEQRRKFRNIVITRPMIALENENNMGFLPGDINDKMGPWLKPIYRTMSQISYINEDNKKIIEKVKETNKVEIQPLDYVRGLTFVRDILVCDEMQNCSQHAMRTLITRAGEGTKMIFTGDLAQIDMVNKLNAETSGLAYASAKMSNQKMVATTHFKKTVRSELAYLAEKLLK